MDSSNDQAKLADRNYIRWDAEGVEKVAEHEEEDMHAVGQMLNISQKMQWDKHRHCFGGTHARTQGLIKGKLVVHDNLPPHLKQSMFDHPAEYPVICRYSSEPGNPGLDDRIPQPRGFAMKIFNVQGDFLPSGVGIPTQDIEFNSAPAIELADAKTTREILDLRLKYMDNPTELYKHIEARPDADLQKSRDQVPNIHLESHRQYSQTAFRFGDYAAKYALVPNSQTQKKLANETVKPDTDPSDILSRWLQSFHRDHDAEYLLQFQLLENLEEQPVEYAGAIWDEEKYPFQTVATLVVPRQDSFDFEMKNFWEDHIRMDPWHGLKTLQPLGNPNRLRRVVYPISSALRRKMNARPEVNVKSIAEVPGPIPAALNNFLELN